MYRRESPDSGLRLNSTNTAIKGIIAIGAMSQMSGAVGEHQDMQHYSVCAQISHTVKKLCSLTSNIFTERGTGLRENMAIHCVGVGQAHSLQFWRSELILVAGV